MMGRISFTTDSNLKIVSWGKKISEYTGIPASNVKGRPYYEVIPRISLNGFNDLLEKSFTEKRPIVLKNYLFRCLKGCQSADIKITPGKNNRIYVSIKPNNICKFEDQLKSCERLIDMGKLASTLAHGVRSPLNAIKGAVVYLRERYPEEKHLLEFTKIMEDEITKLDNFISRFLTGSIITGHEITEIDLNSLIKKLEIYTSMRRESQNIKTEFLHDPVPKIMADPFHLEHAILNLLNNAFEAVGKNGVVRVKVYPEKRDGKSYAVVEITDNGPGIRKKPSSLTSLPRKGESHGFGLFIAREVIQFFSGSLEITGQKGKGTRVKISLPAS